MSIKQIDSNIITRLMRAYIYYLLTIEIILYKFDHAIFQCRINRYFV